LVLGRAGPLCAARRISRNAFTWGSSKRHAKLRRQQTHRLPVGRSGQLQHRSRASKAPLPLLPQRHPHLAAGQEMAGFAVQAGFCASIEAGW